ncbi:hypothetical protein ACQP3C_29745, partial [Escherichia coli]
RQFHGNQFLGTLELTKYELTGPVLACNNCASCSQIELQNRDGKVETITHPYSRSYWKLTLLGKVTSVFSKGVMLAT